MIIFFLCIFFTTTFASVSKKVPNELMQKIVIHTLSDCSNTELFCNLKLTSKTMNNFICNIPEKNPYFLNYRFRHFMSQEDTFFKYTCMHYHGYITYPEHNFKRKISSQYHLDIMNKIIKKDNVRNQNKKQLLLDELLSNKKNKICVISTRKDFDYRKELMENAKTYWDNFEGINKLITIYFDFEHYTGCQGGFSLPGVIEAFLDNYPSELSKNIQILHIKNKSEKFSLGGQKFSNVRELFLYGQAMPLDQTLQNLPHLETLKIWHIPENSIHVVFPNIKTLILKAIKNLDLSNFPSLEFLQITKMAINEFPSITPPDSLKKVILGAILRVPINPCDGKVQSNCINISYFNNFIKKASENAKIILELQIYAPDNFLLIELSKLYRIWLKYVSTLYLISIKVPRRSSSSFITSTKLKNPYVIVDPKNYRLTLHPVFIYSEKQEKILRIFKNFQKNDIKIFNLTIENEIFNEILLQLHDYFPHLQKLEISLEINKPICKLLFQQNKSLKEIHTPTKIKSSFPLKNLKKNLENQNVKVISKHKNNYWFDHLPHLFITFLFLISYLKYVCKNYFPS